MINAPQKDKNKGISISQKIQQTPNEVSGGRNDTLKASFQGGYVVADSGENPDVLTTNGACIQVGMTLAQITSE